MTSNTIAVPFNRPVAGLCCVWSLTGTADHPLACKWIPGELHARFRSASIADPHLFDNCA